MTNHQDPSTGGFVNHIHCNFKLTFNAFISSQIALLLTFSEYAAIAQSAARNYDNVVLVQAILSRPFVFTVNSQVSIQANDSPKDGTKYMDPVSESNTAENAKELYNKSHYDALKFYLPHSNIPVSLRMNSK